MRPAGLSSELCPHLGMQFFVSETSQVIRFHNNSSRAPASKLAVASRQGNFTRPRGMFQKRENAAVSINRVSAKCLSLLVKR